MDSIKNTPPVGSQVGGNEIVNGFININANKKLGKQQCQTKPTSKQVFDNNNVRNLIEVSCSNIDDFIDFLDAGNTIYSGVFKEDAKKLTIEDVAQTQIVFIDIDGGNLYEFLDLNTDFIEEYGFVIQPSISSELIVPNKFHLFLFLDKPINDDEDYKKIWDWCHSNIDFTKCKVDKSKNAFNNLIFFSDKKCINNFTNFLNSSEIILQQNALLEQVEKNNAIEKIDDVNGELDETVNAQNKRKKEGITGLVLNYIYEKIYIEKCDGDIDKLYCLFNHKFKKRRISGKESGLGITRKWDGSNPFSDTNSSGTSLCISQFGEQLPVFFDRSQSYGEHSHLQGKYRNGGTFLSYWWECGKLGLLKELGIKKKPYTGELQDKGKFSAMLKDITKYFEVENFDFRKQSKLLTANETKNNSSTTSENKSSGIDAEGGEEDENTDYLDSSKYQFTEIMEDLEKYLIGKIYHCQWEDGLYLYFSRSSKTWNYTKSVSHIVSHVVQPLVKELYDDRKLTRSPKLIEKLTERIQNECAVEFGKLDKPPEQDVNKTPFLNGVYDLETKKLYDYDDEHLDGVINYYVVPRNYEEVPDDDPIIEKFHSHFPNWLLSEDKAKCLESWAILNIQRQAYRTGKLVAIIGQSGAGKTTYGSFLVNLFGNDTGNFAIKVDSNDLIGNGSSHNTSVLEGRNVFVLEEFLGDNREHNTSIDNIKAYTGEESDKGVLLTVNPKHEKHRTIRLKGAFTCSRQGMIQTKEDDPGVTRRFIIITLEKKSITDANGKSWEFLNLDENLATIFNWGLRQDTNFHLKRFKKYSQCPEIKNNALQNRKDNNPVFQWLESCVHITNNEDDYILSSDFCNAYRLWAKNNGHPQFSSQKFMPRFKNVLNDTDYFEEKEVKGVEFKQKRLKGHQNAKRVILGVKLLDIDDVVITDSIDAENKLGQELEPKPSGFAKMAQKS